MAIYGYWQWSKNTNSQQDNSATLAIVSWSASLHLKACFALAILASALGYLMANYTTASFPYLDTFTTVYAVFATYLVAQKVLENWLYWIVINLVSIYLYIEKALVPTTVLFIIFVIVACYGYLKWLTLYKQSAITLQPEVSS
jgi:nicotinamide mononucleotide transporter